MQAGQHQGKEGIGDHGGIRVEDRKEYTQFMWDLGLRAGYGVVEACSPCPSPPSPAQSIGTPAGPQIMLK